MEKVAEAAPGMTSRRMFLIFLQHTFDDAMVVDLATESDVLPAFA